MTAHEGSERDCFLPASCAWLNLCVEAANPGSPNYNYLVRDYPCNTSYSCSATDHQGLTIQAISNSGTGNIIWVSVKTDGSQSLYWGDEAFQGVC